MVIKMILNKVTYDSAKNSHLFVDVRSPSEYEEDSIPNSVNIPLMNDEERKAVGTTYKQIGKNEARRLGVEIISPKMPGLFEQILELKNKNLQIVAFCARGGYRSTFFASVFSSIGIPIAQLEDGYKGYRKEVITTIPVLNENITYIVLHGNTGVGKTDILHTLKNIGYSILDLEGAANHRGSLLGSIGIGGCNSQKKFETKIYEQLISNNSQYVFVEAESRKIGKVVIPDYISEKMSEGIHIFIDADLDYRVNSLKKDYVQNDNWKDESIGAIERLNKYISKENIDSMKNEIVLGNFDFVAKELMQKYYDPMYSFKSDTLEYNAKFKASTNCDDIAQEIAKWLESCILNKE